MTEEIRRRLLEGASRELAALDMALRIMGERQGVPGLRAKMVMRRHPGMSARQVMEEGRRVIEQEIAWLALGGPARS